MSVCQSPISFFLLVGATVVALGCRDATPLGVASPPPGGVPSALDRSDDADDDGAPSDTTDGGQEGEDSLVACRPLPYDSVTQTIGPAGGFIEVRHNWLLVPRGALSAPVTITAVAPSDTVAMVRFQPEGLQFQTTAILVLTYDNCRIPTRVTPRIALVTDAFQVIEFLSPVNVPLDNRFKKAHGKRQVIGELRHFSNYAVAW